MEQLLNTVHDSLSEHEFGELLAKDPTDLVSMISVLRTRLQSSESAKKAREKEVSELTEQLKKHKVDHGDIVSYLNAELNDKGALLVELEMKLQNVQTRAIAMEEEYVAQLEAEKEFAQNEEKRLKERISVLERRLEDLRDFTAMKEELETALDRLQKQIVVDKEESEKKRRELERKCVQDKEQVRRDMVAKLEETRRYLLRMTDEQLDATTKKTIKENDHMRAELVYQCRQTEKIMKQCDDLLQENKDLKLRFDLSEQQNSGLFQRACSLQRTIKALMTKVKEMSQKEEELRKYLSRLEAARDGAGTGGASAAAFPTLAETEEMLDLQAKYEAARSELLRIGMLVDETTRFLLTSLDDVKHQLGQAKAIEAGELTLEELHDGLQKGDMLYVPAALDSLDLSLRQKVIEFLVTKVQSLDESLQNPTRPVPPSEAPQANPPSATPLDDLASTMASTIAPPLSARSDRPMGERHVGHISTSHTPQDSAQGVSLPRIPTASRDDAHTPTDSPTHHKLTSERRMDLRHQDRGIRPEAASLGEFNFVSGKKAKGRTLNRWRPR
eukprot:Rmarinus@m.12617